MKFRTEIEIAPFGRTIDHTRRGLSVGSCFAASIADRLRRAKFPVTSNPTGVLYNPFSIADLLEARADLLNDESMSRPIEEADYLLITFGTAWVYEENGRVVANCEKRPAHLFTRRRLSVDEIVARFDTLLQGPLHNKQTIFTLSPVRHLKDGFEENSLSKATLRLAIAELTRRHANAQYFPAFEILTDDLRDYRFCGPDLTHPSTEAVEYIWEKFTQAAFTPETQRLLPEIERIVRATEHRPFGPDTEEHAAFRHTMLTRTRDLAARCPQLDLGAEVDFFS
ncbi:MAG: GSCFA domain-containing protein [Alistipes sp.]|nr:GSCFA domain-containing protein [Alistipes sp.]